MTVLLVDDNELLLVTRKLIFERAGYHVIAAQSGATALSLFDAHPIDVAVVDYYLPDMNGEEVCRAIKARNSHVHVVLASGMIPAEVPQCADYFVLKGGSPLELVNKVTEITRAA